MHHPVCCQKRLSCLCQQQLSKTKEQGTCYLLLCYITHLRIHAIKICSKLHVVIDGYIVTVRYVNIYIYIYLYTTILPWSCTDGRYFYHISGTALFSGTNSGFFGTIEIFLLYFWYTCPNQEIGFKWK